jgi:hypothetical protein
VAVTKPAELHFNQAQVSKFLSTCLSLVLYLVELVRLTFCAAASPHHLGLILLI